MKRILSAVFVGLLVSAMTCGSVWAQATAQISGAVRDQSGAVLPGAEVTATQTDTAVSRMTITNETGYYVLPNLPLGPYRLEASLPGFRTFVQTGIVLQVGSSPAINVVMEVGQITEQVEVQANAALVETRTLSVGQVMETTRIMELPLNGRNAAELLLLGGGAVQVTPPGGNAFPGMLLISSAGSLGPTTEYTLDGGRHVDPYDGYPMPLPFPDALAEFKTELGGLSAQQGAGSQVSAVTKSGTNQFHGDLFEFVRNDLFTARSYFATKASTLKRNQFGGTLGGPIMQNKLFFFGGYQGTTLRQDPSDRREFVPTAAMLAGDFTTFASAACNSRGAITLKAPFVGNRVDPALLSPVALKLSARLPKTNNPCGELTYGRKSVTDEHQVVSKIDYQSSAKHSLFGRLLFLAYDSPSPLAFTSDIVLNAQPRVEARSYAFTTGSTYLLSSTTVNAFRLSVTRNRQSSIRPDTFSPADIGMNIYAYDPNYLPAITVSSGFVIGDSEKTYATALYQLADDVSMTRGTHQFGFGGRISQGRTNNFYGGSDNGFFTITGSVTGAGLADFLTGKVNDYTHGGVARNSARVKFLSIYGQDTWQVRPRLTMSYGLRWSPALPIVEYSRPIPNVLNFSVERYRQGLRSSVLVNAPPGMLYPGDPEFVQKNGGVNAEKPQSHLYNTYWKQFVPRIGLAWDVQGDGRTSLRASYGLSYPDATTVRRGTQNAQPPWGSLTSLLLPEGGLDDPWRGIAGGNPHPTQTSKTMTFSPASDYLPSNPDLTPMYTQSWNLSLQRQVTADTLLSVSYLGTQIIHIPAATPLNMAIYVPGVGDAGGNCFLNGTVTHFKVAPGSACSTVNNTQVRRALTFLNPAFGPEIGRIAYVSSDGTQNYQAMLVSVQHRPSRGINLNGNYTLSHCIGDFSVRSNNGFGIAVDHTYLDPNDRKRDRGNCESDQRHALNLTGVVETPQFANRMLSLVGTGWRLSLIYQASTGGNLTAGSAASGVRTVTLAPASTGSSTSPGADRCLCDINAQRPDLLSTDVYLDTSGRPGTQYLNPAAFGQPALGALGTMGRTNLTVPYDWQFDMALSRVFRFRESQSLEFRAEAYNVTNSFRPGIIDTVLSSSNFGKIRTALTPRIMQFALKYLF
jgi:hypothetical protein